MTTPQTGLAAALDEFPATYAKTARFSLGAPRNIKLVDGGRRVLFCRSKAGDDPMLCLWTLDAETGTERLLVDPASLAGADDALPPAERARRERARESASGIVAFSVDGAGQRCCFALAGELFIADLDDGSVTSASTVGAVFDPRLNEQGTAVAYSASGALRLCTLEADGSTIDRELRSDPDPLVSHGRAEFVAAEEMGRSRGFWWSPDGESLLATRVDESPVAQWWIADPAHPERPANGVRYPAAGGANATVALELVGLDGSARTVEWDEGGRFEYLAEVVWQNGHEPLVVRQTRDQRTVSIATIDLDAEPPIATGRQTITDGVWVELIGGTPRWCSGGLLTIEDTPSTRSLHLDGAAFGPPNLNVRSIVGCLGSDDIDQTVIATAWTEPTEIHLVAVPLPAAPGAPTTDGSTVTALTADPGVHGAVLGGSTLVMTGSEPDRPGGRTTVHTVELGGDSNGARNGPVALGPATAEIVDHALDPGFPAAPSFLALGPDRLASALFLPSDHDGASPLPVLLDPYAGPHAQRVLKAHNPHLVSRWFAEQGYAVLVTDGRGTPGRGPAWERAVFGDLAEPVLDDQVAALDAVLDRHPFLDADRVAMRGWSFGGYLAALAVLRRPDRFHAAIAGAPVTTWRLYDTHYTERYLGHPATDGDHYDRSDLWIEAEGGPLLDRLERPLLLVHGLADDNVVAAHTLRFSTALLATGSPHRVLPLSGVTHMTPQVAVAENLLRLQLDFLDETIGGP